MYRIVPPVMSGVCNALKKDEDLCLYQSLTVGVCIIIIFSLLYSRHQLVFGEWVIVAGVFGEDGLPFELA
ncbi:hypothetical protein B5X24_HaOG201721 [Helicoverpa armigera]|nr:hypothetical protein B5X24_HaOG201721 [Helicoverpa armigera]